MTKKLGRFSLRIKGWKIASSASHLKPPHQTENFKENEYNRSTLHGQHSRSFYAWLAERREHARSANGLEGYVVGNTQKLEIKNQGFDLEIELNCDIERRGYDIIEISTHYISCLEIKLRIKHGLTIMKGIIDLERF